MEMNQYLDVFIDESREHLQSVNDHLLQLEENPDDIAIVQEIFRSAHTLKGMAATMGFDEIADLTHHMENVLDNIRNQKTEVTTNVLDLLLEAVDSLETMVGLIAEGGDGKRDVGQLVERLDKMSNGDEAAASVEISPEQAEKSDRLTLDEFERTVIEQSKEQGFRPYFITVELNKGCILKSARTYMVFDVLEKIGEIIKSIPPVEMLEEERFDYEFSVVLLTKANREEIEKKIFKVSEIERVEVVELKELPTAEKRSSEKRDMDDSKTPTPSSDRQPKQQQLANSSKTIRVNIDRLDHLMNLFEELVIDRGRLEEIAKTIKHDELIETVERMSRISGDLQNIILTMRMVPIEQVFNRFPRMVRSLAKELNKKVHFEMVGAETELDRTVIDEIGDPLVHLIRNSLDHGIEAPEIREKHNKPAEGHVILKAYHRGNHVFIEIEDDGAGISREKVLAKITQKGLVSSEEASKLSDDQIHQFIFSSGFSTAEQISDISGRGVGLDVVKNKIESLGGNVQVESEQGKGTRFLIQLPLTLSIMSVLLVEVGNEKYAIPLSSIIETAIINAEELMNAHHQKVMDFRGKVVPLVFLSNVFEVPEARKSDDYYSVVVVKKGEKMAGIVVDSFIGQQEVVLKSLGDYLKNVFAISGATILGDGQVALIVDCNALIK